MTRREGNLFDLCEIVFRIFVQCEFAEWSEGNFLLWPHLGQVKDVPTELLSLLRAKDLEIAGPAGIVAVLDRVEQILRMPVGVLGCHITSFGTGESFTALVRLTMDLDVAEAAIGFRELVSMA